MDPQDTTGFKRFAILVGINAYSEKPLKACVRDVKRIRAYLDKLSPHVDTTMMVAGGSDVDVEPSDPTGYSVNWPTVKNVLAALDRVNSMSKAGDFVYVHFSGHGTRKAPEDEFSNQSTGDLALVLCDDEKRSAVKYLNGWQLAQSLKSMVDKKVAVTLVLDCCFSATVYRKDDPEVRFLQYDPNIGLDDSTEYQGHAGSEDDTSRHASMLPNWIMNPDGYAILSACGPHEEAREPRFDGENCGALSYFLLKALSSGNVAATHRDIYAYIRAHFKKSNIPQSPVLYGNRLQAFFAPPMSDNISEIVPVVEKRGDLQLQAGIAHGVVKGDQFLLSPLGSIDLGSESQPGSTIAHVTNTEAFVSSLELLGPAPISVKTGWVARHLTRHSLRKFPVHVDKKIPEQEEWGELLRERSLATATDHPFSFNIVLNGDSDCEILDEQGRPIPNTPTIALNDRKAINHVCDTVGHLARFKAIETLSNHTMPGSLRNPFRQSFKLHLSHISAGREATVDPGQLTEVQDGERIRLVLMNIGQECLYMYVYNMSSDWQVENILRAGYETIPPSDPDAKFGGKFEKRVKFTVPLEEKEKAYTQCHDILKVFITSRPTSFDLLELPKLGETPKRVSTSFDEGRGNGNYGSDGWETFEFPVRTYIPALP
ncbi:Caspase domain containing protein [Rhypophila decipiens]